MIRRKYKMIEITEEAYNKLYILAGKFHCLGIDAKPNVEDFIEDIADNIYPVITQQDFEDLTAIKDFFG